MTGVQRLPWLGRSQAVVDEYLAFLGNLVSAQTVYLCACLNMVVSHFTPKRVTICEGGVDISDSDDEDENFSSSFSTSRFLMPILQENFPFIQKSSRTLECYVHNLLRITVYVPSIRRDLLELIIGKLLKLDVNASHTHIEEAEENRAQTQKAEEQTEECLFDMLSQALAEAFLDHLWKILQNPSLPAVLRQAAAGYLGSFLARAKFIPLSTVRACLDLLSSWIHQYIYSQDSCGKQVCCDVSLHGPFYTSCQAVFYTIIFRHRALLEANMKKGRIENFELISCRLEESLCISYKMLVFSLLVIPTSSCFCCRKYQVVFCYTIIERNNRCVLPVVRSSAGGDCVTTNTNPLDSFFPFDPYLLKRSGQLIEPLYQVWDDLSDTEPSPTKRGQQGSKEDEDDFLCGETPQAEGIVGLTPNSYDSNFHSPSSLGSPPNTLQRPF
ncbi:RNA polymerase I-specific transcription initiation factor RRN3 [Neolamprologus brichardi]|uniref:RNA polymerase I-specific transcription initiation factor RRN3 n=1 Tax=Neolamprologus brichardi TaxID=32507 RepID=UPI001643CB32|nr:RNA polymerase I-specific transcription initiation factor RRN3 [Neolamprologus brichardi]